MPDSATVTVLEQQNHQRTGARRATLAALRAKKPPTSEFVAKINDEDEEPMSFLFVAINQVEYDDLCTEHPATDEQKEKNPQANINSDTFPPALLARVCREPKISAEDWAELWVNPNYTRMELLSLYWEANGLCNRPLNLAPFVKESDETPPIEPS